MGFSKIAAVAYHLPERILSDAEIARLHPEWDIARISQKTGIVERRRAGEDETALDLGVRAAERLFALMPTNGSVSCGSLPRRASRIPITIMRQWDTTIV